MLHCISLTTTPIQRAGYVDSAKVAAVGGSHGGLLTGHLVGQHPSRFAAGVLRNPVMDISLMVHVSDIPDWCYCEAWGAEVRRVTAGTLDEPWLSIWTCAWRLSGVCKNMCGGGASFGISVNY